jgi:alcohol dehydrogenase
MEELSRMYEIQVPRTIIEINGSDRVGMMAKEFKAKKTLIVTDAGVIGAGLIDRVKGALEKEKVSFEIYPGCLASAPLASVRECAKLIEGGQFDLIIAVGGGSVMDTAKVAAIVAAHGGDVSVLFEPGKIRNPGIRKIFLPTTSGTGSEVSNGAVFTDEASKRKIPVFHEYMWVDAAIIDPALTLNLPPSATADTGIDALCHAIEGYTCWKANTLTEMFTEKAIRLVAENLRVAYAKGSKHIEARYNMALAAALAMVGLRTSASYIVHSLSYIIT